MSVVIVIDCRCCSEMFILWGWLCLFGVMFNMCIRVGVGFRFEMRRVVFECRGGVCREFCEGLKDVKICETVNGGDKGVRRCGMLLWCVCRVEGRTAVCEKFVLMKKLRVDWGEVKDFFRHFIVFLFEFADECVFFCEDVTVGVFKDFTFFF